LNWQRRSFSPNFAPASTPTSSLKREQILAALESLSDQLGSQGITGEVCLFGGTVMVLAFTARLATKDVDAIFQPVPVVRDIARRIAGQHHLPADWLNDGVKRFFPPDTNPPRATCRSSPTCA
jgi:hypothetical protein